MTTTEQLIGQLTENLRPTPRFAARQRLVVGVGGGAAAATALMIAWLGIRPDLAAAMATIGFWVKFLYTLLLGVAGFWAVDRCARPGGGARGAAFAALSIVAVVALLAMAQFAGSPAAMNRQLMLGHSADICPWIIVALSLPILCATIWAVRGLAPTRLPLAGAAAGLMAASLAAFIYSFHCDEWAIPFLAMWYSLGIAIVGMVGAIAGRFVLRW